MSTYNNWQEDFKAELVMRELGIAWVTENVAIKNINWKYTDTNMGRSGFTGKPYSDETVEDIAFAIKNDHPIAMPIIARTKDHGDILNAGVHRGHGSKRAALAFMKCYVYTPTSEAQIRAVAIATNRMEGNRVGPKEALEYAVRLVQNHDLSPIDAAKIAKIKPGPLNERLRCIKVRKRLAAAGFRHEITHSMAGHLYAMDLDTVLVAAARALYIHKKDANDAHQLAKLTKAESNEAARLALIARIEHEWATESGISAQACAFPATTKQGPADKQAPPPVCVAPVRKKFLAAITALESVLKGKTTLRDLQIEPDSDAAKLLSTRWAAIKRSLNAITTEK